MMIDGREVAKDFFDRLVLLIATRGGCNRNCFTCEYFKACEEDFYADDKWEG